MPPASPTEGPPRKPGATKRFSPEALARAASRRPWVFVGGWIGTVVLAVVLIALLLGGALSNEQRLTNNPESLRAADLVQTKFEERNTAADLVIVRSQTLTVDDPAFRQRVEQLAASLTATELVLNVRTFFASNDTSLVSRDRGATLIQLGLLASATESDTALKELIDLVEASSDQRFQVNITGEAAFDYDLGLLAQNDLKTGELFFGGPAALVILLLVFGAVVAALIPLLMAIIAIIVTLALIALLGQTFEISVFVVNMVTAMGLALGIDYSLFVLSRYREERRKGREKLDAIEAAGATASRAVLFSGLAFVLALMGMLLVPDLILHSLAAGAIVVGFVSVIAALTLLPALLSLFGDRINALRVPFAGRNIAAQGAQEGRFWTAIVRRVMRRPVLSLTLSVALLLAAAVPILDYETGFAGTNTFPDDVPSKQGFLALNESFPGATADPALVVVTGNSSAPGVSAGIERLQALVDQDPVFGPPTVQRARSGDATLVEIPVAGDAQGARAIEAVKRLRSEYVPQAFPQAGSEILVGGQTADTIDYTETTGFWMPIIFAFVLGLSFVLLTIAFRSIVVPLKAILLNLLSVGAAYGLLVLVFVKGVGADLLGFQQVDTIVAWVPLFLFSVLFGLSMDYHVFLLSRIRERFLQTGDNEQAVEQGVSSTARLITGAALIIIAVFTGFARGDLVMFQQMGFGIGVALFIDATLIRSVLVPASMKLLGERNWYFPSFLRWLPDVGVEGEVDGEKARPGPVGTR